MELGTTFFLLSGLGVLGLSLLTAIIFRRVVPTNEVHIVQSSKATVSYGKDSGNGNTYYEWPSWMPLFGVTKVRLPVNIFDLDLEGYEAYDQGRLPFVVDVKAFFQITNSNIAAQSVLSFDELREQLKAIVQGAVRVILASNSIETILQGRSTFGEQFTKEVAEQLTRWGVSAVKNIELMDIRDSNQGSVIRNIMDKKKSLIEMESRSEVAKNKKVASVAEIEAQREVDFQKQVAMQSIGLRTIEAEREVALQKEAKIQALTDQMKVTKDKEMAVAQVAAVRDAEITRDVELVKAEQNRKTALIQAEAYKDSTILTAQGKLEAKRREAEGISVEGQAKADAEKAMQLAPVAAQITLAKEIGANESYQKYLITVKQVEAQQAVGIEQAKALEQADVKVIANTGAPTSGLSSVMDLFSSRGGTELGAMLEGLGNTEKGQALLGTLGLDKKSTTKTTTKSNGAAH